MPGQRCIALLRGINVGRAKRIAMADLRQLVGELGCTDVRTLLNSGNVVFTAPARARARIAARIQDAMVLKLGVVSRVIVLGSDELERVIAANPLLEVATDHARLLVFVFSDADAPALLAPLATSDWGLEVLSVGEHAAYLWCPAGVLDSKAMAAMTRLLGDRLTSRNWNTLCKLRSLCAEPAKG